MGERNARPMSWKPGTLAAGVAKEGEAAWSSAGMSTSWDGSSFSSCVEGIESPGDTIPRFLSGTSGIGASRSPEASTFSFLRSGASEELGLRRATFPLSPVRALSDKGLQTPLRCVQGPPYVYPPTARNEKVCRQASQSP